MTWSDFTVPGTDPAGELELTFAAEPDYENASRR